jgi:hypothetical protein
MMTERRPGERPAHVKPPTHLSPSPPLPQPGPAPEPLPADSLDPTRYGDWEKKGIAIDF